MRRVGVISAVSAVLLGGCALGGSAPPATYDILAPKVMTLSAPRPSKVQLVVNEPSAVRSLETDRIMVKPGTEQISYYKGAAWSDRLPRLLQARMVESFQNAGLVSGVGARGDRLDADLELATQIQSFQVEVGSGSAEAHANLHVKVVDGQRGRIVASRSFESRVRTSPDDVNQMVASLNQAFDSVLREMVPWVAKQKRAE
ncbi:MAG: ABC-type transport auxiliary lipoprotein family protein [Pseudomonadota bacterium]|nr:ABC-type transport auxiliary lipoprotein family protein [Pseudomonadota bacterium]